jgi:fimbrial chaperone protein
MSRHLIRSLSLGLASLLASPLPTSAGSFSVNPVRMDLSAKQPVASVTVRNDGAEATVVQLELMGWAQADNNDVYDATSELLATPPLFTVPPGGSRVVRVGLRRRPDPGHELTYRLYLQEVPPPMEPDFRGMRMTLRVGVPIFVAANSQTRPELKWSTVAEPGGKIKLSLLNSGSEHVKIADLELSTDTGGTHSSGVQRVATYVLPGQKREWLLQMDGPVVPGSKVRIKAHTDAHAELAANLALDAT